MVQAKVPLLHFSTQGCFSSSPTPSPVMPGLQQSAAPLETAVLATAGEGSKGRLLLETPVPTLTPLHGASQAVLVVKNPPANAQDIKRCGFNSWVRKMP